MGVLIVLAAALIGIYGVTAGSGWALILAAVSMGAGIWRLSGERAESDYEVMRRNAATLVSSPWRLAAVSTLVLSWIASWKIGQDDPTWLGTGLWLTSLALAVVSGVLHDGGRQVWKRLVASIEWGRSDWLIVVSCTAVAFGLRLYRLDSLLPPMHGDEGEMGTLARLALYGPGAGRGDTPLPVFGTGFLDHPTLFHQVQALSMRVFGDSIFSLRLLSVLVGTATLPFVYLIARIGWGRVAAFTASWLLAVSQLHIQYSRIALNNIESLLLIVATIALLVLAGHRGSSTSDDGPEPRLTLFVLIGLTAGVSQYFYYGSRVLAVIVPLVLWQLVRANRARLVDVAVVAVSGLVAALPLARFYAAHVPTFTNRARGVSIFNEVGAQRVLGPDASWPRDLPEMLVHQVRSNVGYFVNGGDASAFYSRVQPSFDQVTLLLFWLGLGVVVVQCFDRSAPSQITAGRSPTAAKTVLTWFFAVFVTAGLLTNDAPNSPRLLMMVPAIFILGGAAAQFGRDMFAQLRVERGRMLGLAAASILALVTIWTNTGRYFSDYASNEPRLVIEIANEMSEVSDTTRVLLLGDPHLFVEYGTIRFVANESDRANLLETDSFEVAFEEATTADKDLLLVVLPARMDDLDAIRVIHPSGALVEHLDQSGSISFTTYFLETH